VSRSAGWFESSLPGALTSRRRLPHQFAFVAAVVGHRAQADDEEAWELVEEKGMAEEDFYAFSFGNAVRLWASLNSDFFKGTVVENSARQFIESEMSAQSAAAS
jgi:hypothetical protein